MIVVSVADQSVNVSTCTPWATKDDVCGPAAALDVALLDDCLQGASDVLFHLAGRQYPGVCQDTVRPCTRNVRPDHGRPVPAYFPMGGYSTYGVSIGMGGWNPTWGMCEANVSHRAGCCTIPEITLGAYPVRDVVEVKVDGVTLSPATYRLDDNRWLVRLPDADGDRPGWPVCQDLLLPATEPGTFEVTFTYGSAPPPMGRRGAAELAGELALACSGSPCQLPERITSITRQGVSMVVLDPMAFLDKGRTGLYACDLFLSAVNPKAIQRRATVISPDTRRRVRRSQR